MRTTKASLLNLNQSPEDLNSVHGEDCYHYLRSPEFLSTFMSRIGRLVNQYGLPCLDVGCGEGYLYDFLDVPYAGFDGSEIAINKARQLRPRADIILGRIESPPALGVFGTLVFGGLLGALVEQSRHIDFCELYRRHYQAQYLIVYDLVSLDTKQLDGRYDRVSSFVGTAMLPTNDPKIITHRKIECYELS